LENEHDDHNLLSKFLNQRIAAEAQRKAIEAQQGIDMMRQAHCGGQVSHSGSVSVTVGHS